MRWASNQLKIIKPTLSIKSFIKTDSSISKKWEKRPFRNIRTWLRLRTYILTQKLFLKSDYWRLKSEYTRGNIDVVDGCWRWFVLVATLRCWWQISDVGDLFSILKKSPTLGKIHEYKDSATNIYQLSSSFVLNTTDSMIATEWQVARGFTKFFK